MLFHRLALRLVLSLVDTQHRFFDIEFVHLLQGICNVIIALTNLREVFEHVLRGHLEHLPALLIHQQRANKVVKIRRVIIGYGEHQVDDRYIRRHRHGAFLGLSVVGVRYKLTLIYASPERRG